MTSEAGMTKMPKPREDLIVRKVDKDYVVYDPVSDITALLNPTAAMVLTQCDGATTVEEIRASIEETFGLEEGVMPTVCVKLMFVLLSM